MHAVGSMRLMIAHHQEAPVIAPFLGREDRIHRRLQGVISSATGNAAEESEHAAVRIEHHLLAPCDAHGPAISLQPLTTSPAWQDTDLTSVAAGTRALLLKALALQAQRSFDGVPAMYRADRAVSVLPPGVTAMRLCRVLFRQTQVERLQDAWLTSGEHQRTKLF